MLDVVHTVYTLIDAELRWQVFQISTFKNTCHIITSHYNSTFTACSYLKYSLQNHKMGPSPASTFL